MFMKVKLGQKNGFIICALLILLPSLLLGAWVFCHVPSALGKLFLTVIPFLLICVGVFGLCRKLLPLLRMNENISMVLSSAGMESTVPEGISILDHFQMLMDREYASRVSSREAELDALQSQINPHFLYNTLESIRGQAVMEGADVIAEMAYALSSFFRYSINRKEKLVLLEDEFRNVKNYIKIQNYRFNNKYALRIYMDEADRPVVDHCQLPRMTIQPIIENALLHGVRDSEREIEYLDISIGLTESKLLIKVTDHGVGICQEKLDEINNELRGAAGTSLNTPTNSGNGIALTNINERIQLAFGEIYGLRVYSTLGFGCTVEIVLPKHLDKTAALDPNKIS